MVYLFFRWPNERGRIASTSLNKVAGAEAARVEGGPGAEAARVGGGVGA